ncbi:thymidine kinase [Flexibacter flexilis DSM 6793]|uniref:Thymidine kinase n=1 Tax=Flexibacter flexilis DSM 6793 TaxID=927664 RepID=A0A1I1FQL2_9BACT|nr:thymidine kinase [Flexibacter flexilis]SFC01296.1 thymidine kinase [Flexibacter flexilis DSM 6793]
MFIEPHFGTPRTGANGWIEVVCGSMFSGKTEELIRRLNRAAIAKQRVEIFKPALDTRYHVENIVSHNDNFISSTPVANATDILEKIGNCQVVGIDEAQFFGEELLDVCVTLANNGVRVIVAGLDMDFMGKPFGQMPALMAVAEFVTKVHAICVQCGGVASYSYRLVESKEKFLLGETQIYEARCRHCFVAGQKEHTEHQA